MPAEETVAGSRIGTSKKRRAKLSGRNGVGSVPLLEGGQGPLGTSAGLGRETPLPSTLSVFCRGWAAPAIVQRFKNKGFLAWTPLGIRGTVPAQGSQASGRIKGALPSSSTDIAGSMEVPQPLLGRQHGGAVPLTVLSGWGGRATLLKSLMAPEQWGRPALLPAPSFTCQLMASQD